MVNCNSPKYHENVAFQTLYFSINACYYISVNKTRNSSKCILFGNYGERQQLKYSRGPYPLRNNLLYSFQTSAWPLFSFTVNIQRLFTLYTYLWKYIYIFNVMTFTKADSEPLNTYAHFKRFKNLECWWDGMLKKMEMENLVTLYPKIPMLVLYITVYRYIVFHYKKFGGLSMQKYNKNL